MLETEQSIRWADASLSLPKVGAPYVDAVRAQLFKGLDVVSGANCSYRIAEGSLPTGLLLDAVTGIVAGTTFGSGTFKFMLGANCNGKIEAQVTQAMSVAPSTTPISPLFLTVPMKPTPALAIPAAKAVCTVTPALPAGLMLNLSTCSVSGVPNKLQLTRDYVVRAISDSYSSQYTFRVGVSSQILGSVFFSPGSSSFSRATLSKLNEIVTITKKANAKQLRVTGFADAMVGTGDRAIAKKRSTAVRNYLQARLPKVSLSVASNGSSDAKLAKLSTKAQAINRRVEIRIK